MKRTWQHRQALGLTLLVCALEMAVIATFHHHQAGAERVRSVFSEVNTLVNRLDALEWRAIFYGKLSAEIESELLEVRASVSEKVLFLEGVDTTKPHAELGLQQCFQRYAAAVDKEFTALKHSDPSTARRIDEVEVDPAFDRLRAALLRGEAHFTQRAARFQRWDAWTTFGSLTVATCAILFLFRYFLDAQRLASEADADRRLLAESYRVQEVLAESERRLRHLGDNLPSGMVYQLEGDATGHRRFVYVSAGVERIHGLTADAMLKDCSAFYGQLSEEDRKSLATREADSLKSLATFTAEVRILNTRGETRWLLLNAAPCPKAGGIVLWDGVELDITARRQIEEYLRQTHKLEAIGHLAGGMAHEFNNILAGIMMSLTLVKDLSSNAEARALLQDVDGLCQRAADLIRQLLAFGRRSIMSFRPLDLAAVAQRQARLWGHLLGENIAVEVLAPRSLPMVMADNVMLEEVLLNLALNARDAMPEGGKLGLRVREIEVHSMDTRNGGRSRPGQYVRIEVSDTGRGMDESTAKRVFDPFFTTKEVGAGTGLGLAVVHGIVEQHQGWIEVQSAPGQGTTFHLYFPIHKSEAEDHQLAQPARVTPDAGAILLVEDDPVLLSANRRFLVARGYTVLEALTVDEALTTWNTHRDRIDVVYSDVVTPGELTGLQLAEHCLAERPDVRVILTSGYSDHLIRQPRTKPPFVHYLSKPCSGETLLATIRMCLAHKCTVDTPPLS